MSSIQPLREVLSKGVALLFVASSFLFFAQLAVADPSPRVQAELLESNTVKLSVKATSKRKGRTRLEIARVVNGSKKLSTIATFKITGTVMVQLLDQSTDGVEKVAYRSRLVGVTQSNWSRPVVIHLDEEKDAPEPPSPPVSPTPRPLPPDFTMPAGLSECPRADVVKVFDSVNANRVAAGVAPIAEHSRLALSSLRFSAHMAEAQVFSHDGWYENIVSSGYEGGAFGQNIGYSSILSADQMMNAWMNSPGHRGNILSSNFQHLGVGCVRDSHGIVWWTQDFGG